ncbi:tRNA (adenosine(37)-N6)-threonylcarbamoyltransferase complex transferase subunit TsaD [Candidatus Daviesbacteria bacterium]|nr:tRNA (adenosine(37)-N6)-threonylcarbamoyltransferase complex transferase subunit TsaD [Candidatus Daviesbacteria bacterium]
MIILGIETSCDETAAAILEKNNDWITILSNVVASSALMQSKYGGIIPEQAAREQIKSIIPVIKEAFAQAKLKPAQIDAIAVTFGPGLIGSLLVGVETAKILSLIWSKPIIAVNHLLGHFYANWIYPKGRGDGERGAPLSARSEARTSNGAVNQQDPEESKPSFPCLGLLVSGGHTDLVRFLDHNKYEYLGGTRDDAAGECFDKCARLLGLAYPGGPEISKYAATGNPKAYKLPRPMINSKDFDFSFSGLKTAVANLIESRNGFEIPKRQNPRYLVDLCASIEAAIIDSLIKKIVLATQKYKVEQVMIAGGVASNKKLISELKDNLPREVKLFVPPAYLCTDNAAMIASAAFFQKPIKNILSLQANPNLSLENLHF